MAQGFVGTGINPTAGVPSTSLSLVKNVFVKQMYFRNSGDVMEGHRHVHDHCTLLASGSVDVTVNGETTGFVAPKVIWIAKEQDHTIVATRAHTVAYCIHAIRDGEGADDIIDPDMVPVGTRNFMSIPGVVPLIHTDEARE